MTFARECERCGGPIPDRRRADAMYCGEPCKRADYLDLQRQGRLDDKAKRPPCQHCGAAIPPEANAGRMFCSLICQRRARHARGKAARPRTCPQCGAGFHACTPTQRFCSLSCYRQSERRAEPLACGCCGVLIPEPMPGQKWCGARCREKAWKQRRKAQG